MNLGSGEPAAVTFPTAPSTLVGRAGGLCGPLAGVGGPALISNPAVHRFVIPDGLVSLEKSTSWTKIYDNGGARISVRDARCPTGKPRA